MDVDAAVDPVSDAGSIPATSTNPLVSNLLRSLAGSHLSDYAPVTSLYNWAGSAVPDMLSLDQDIWICCLAEHA